MRLTGVQILPYSGGNLGQIFGQAPSVRYLEDYFVPLSPGSLLYEEHYIDRHFLDDFVHYYARSFAAPHASCGRVHVFTLQPDELKALMLSAYTSVEARTSAERVLQDAYLGFIVRRPIENAPMGRTVLKTYDVDGRRRYEAIRPYRVNIGGLQLSVMGLAYQQQDGGAAVCASTALWSALQRVAQISGHRTPTPSAITRAAASPFPASAGLSMDQMATALSSLGYVADLIRPAENRALFRAMVATALQSQLPVILAITTRMATGAGEVPAGHAVTVTGYSEPSTVIDVPAPLPGHKAVPMKGGAIDVVYVHDDNLGSHAHYELFESDEVDPTDGYKKQMLRRGRSDRPPPNWWRVDEWKVEAALIPKPPKQRLSLDRLWHKLLWLRHLLENQIFPGLTLHYSMRVASGVDYKRSCFGLPMDPQQRAGFLLGLALPRHCGVLSVFEGDKRLLDVLLDVSEVQRLPDRPSVLGLVAAGVQERSRAWFNLVGLANYFTCGLIAAPASQPAAPGTLPPPSAAP